MKIRSNDKTCVPVLMALVAFCLVSCEQAPDQMMTLTGNTMGTTYSVKVVGVVANESELQVEIQRSVDRIDQLMSNYKPESELSRLNRSELHQTFPLSSETLEVLALSKEIESQSAGAFDISLAPVVELWGFGATGTTTEIPAEEAISTALAATGTAGLSLGNGYAVRSRDISLNLSAIAKGYAVDQVASLLETKGYERFLIEIGGELKGRGTNQANKFLAHCD